MINGQTVCPCCRVRTPHLVSNVCLSNGSGHLVQWDASHWYCGYILESLPWHTRTRNFTSRYVCGIRTNRGYKNFAPNVVNAWKKQRSHPDLLLWPLQCRQTSTPCQDTVVSPRGEVQRVKPFYCFVSRWNHRLPSAIGRTIHHNHRHSPIPKSEGRTNTAIGTAVKTPCSKKDSLVLDFGVYPPAAQFWKHSTHPSGGWVTKHWRFPFRLFSSADHGISHGDVGGLPHRILFAPDPLVQQYSSM